MNILREKGYSKRKKGIPKGKSGVNGCKTAFYKIVLFHVMTGIMLLTGCKETEDPKTRIGEQIELIPEFAVTEETFSEEETMEMVSQRKIPPEGFELVFDSEEWGLFFEEPGMQPRGNAAAEDLAWYDAYYVGNDSEKVIYLTFDCGYENGNTELILDALKKHNVSATFFVVGHFLETDPDLVKKMVQEGHVVGNHTYHHLNMDEISDIETFQKELSDVEDLFFEITGTELSKYYRPPQGKCNVENLKMAQELGYSTIFWSLAHVDWDPDHQPDHAEAIDRLTARIHPGAIVLLHNTSKTNGEILDELLTKWEEMGYTFKPLSDIVYSENT